jgi:hypothetical protein
MSRFDVVSLARAFYYGDRDRLLGILHGGFEWHLCAGLPGGLGGRYSGASVALEALRRFREILALRAMPERFWEARDDHVVVLGHYLWKNRWYRGVLRSGVHSHSSL